MDNSFLNYMRERELDIDKKDIDASSPILEDDTTLAQVASAWSTQGAAFRTVVHEQMRLKSRELLYKARPEEVMVLRQSIADMEQLLEQFAKYAEEHDKRQENLLRENREENNT